MRSTNDKVKKSIKSFPDDLPDFWKQHSAAWRLLLLSIIALAALVAVLPFILDALGHGELYSAIVFISQFFLAVMLLALAFPPTPTKTLSHRIRKYIAAAIRSISFLLSTPLHPPRSRATV